MPPKKSMAVQGRPKVSADTEKAKRGQKRQRSTSLKLEVDDEEENHEMSVEEAHFLVAAERSAKEVPMSDDEEEEWKEDSSDDNSNNEEEDEEEDSDEEERKEGDDEEEDEDEDDDDEYSSEASGLLTSDEDDDENLGSSSEKQLIVSLQQALYQDAPRGQFATGAQMTKKVDDKFNMHVTGFGDVSLPISGKTAKQLIALAKPSPFGQKDKTVYDKNVRSSWQLDPSQMTLSSDWLKKFHTEVFAQLNEEMALHMNVPDELELHLYKLLLYEKGGHFSKHRDSEKESNMFGTFIVVLSCDFSGGALLVQQADLTKTYFNADTIKRTGRSEWAAFFTDCEHELQRVTEGYRIALSFNMIRNDPSTKNCASRTLRSVDQGKVVAVANVLNGWMSQGCGALGIVLKHQYSQAFLNEDARTSLKGTDAITYAIVQAAVERAVRTRNGTASSAELASSSSSISPGPFRLVAQLGEVKVTEEGYFEDERHECGHKKTGRKVQACRFSAHSYLATTHNSALDCLNLQYLAFPPGTKESEIFEGEGEESVEHTGNEGVSYERWYHQTAIILVDASDPWQFIRTKGVTHAPKLFKEAVDALIDEKPATDFSNFCHLLGIRGDVECSSTLEKLTDLAAIL